MDAIDHALMEAWGRLGESIKADRGELWRRRMRLGQRNMTAPLRAWCVVVRAGDTRIGSCVGMVEKGAVEGKRDHVVWMGAEGVRALCAPVRLEWPGVPLRAAAARLGRSYAVVSKWLKRGVFEVRYQPARTLSKRGKRVPLVWTDAAIDSNMDCGRWPSGVWGSMWMRLGERVGDEVELEARREWRGGNGERGTGNGGEGGGKGQRAKLQRADLEGSGDSDPSIQRCSDTSEEGGSVMGRWVWRCPLCARVCEELYLPVREWTLAEALGWEGGKGQRANLQRANSEGKRDSDPSIQRCSDAWNGAGNGESGRGGQEGTSEGFACCGCHRVMNCSMVGAKGWGVFVSRMSGGLLYGWEVARPVEARGVRRVKAGLRREAKGRRERVRRLCAAGWTLVRIGKELGVSKRCVQRHVSAICEEEGVGGKGALRARVRQSEGATVRQQAGGRATGERATERKAERRVVAA